MLNTDGPIGGFSRRPAPVGAAFPSSPRPARSVPPAGRTGAVRRWVPVPGVPPPLARRAAPPRLLPELGRSCRRPPPPRGGPSAPRVAVQPSSGACSGSPAGSAVRPDGGGAPGPPSARCGRCRDGRPLSLCARPGRATHPAPGTPPERRGRLSAAVVWSSSGVRLPRVGRAAVRADGRCRGRGPAGAALERPWPRGRTRGDGLPGSNPRRGCGPAGSGQTPARLRFQREGTWAAPPLEPGPTPSARSERSAAKGDEAAAALPLPPPRPLPCRPLPAPPWEPPWPRSPSSTTPTDEAAWSRCAGSWPPRGWR